MRGVNILSFLTLDSHSKVARMYTCTFCGANFTRAGNMRRHQKESCKNINRDGPPAKQSRLDSSQSTSASLQTCRSCNVTLTANQMISHKRTLQHRTNSCVPLMDGVEVVRSAFKYRIITYRVHSENEKLDYVLFFNEIRHKILNLLEEILLLHNTVKVNMETFARYILPTQELSDMKSFNTPNKIMDHGIDLNDVFDTFVDMMITQTTEFQERDSGMYFFY